MADDSMGFTVILGVGGIISGAMCYAFYRLSRSKNDIATQVESTTVWHPDTHLHAYLNMQDNRCLDYAVIEGVVKELGPILQSIYSREVGVIRRFQVVEHKSKFMNGMWNDIKRTLKDRTEMVPFAVAKYRGEDSNMRVEVIDAYRAAHLVDELEITYDRFEPSKNELDRFYGEYTKGIQETENMLITGTSILGVGKVCLQQGQMKIGPPDDSDKFYIITRLRLGELVDFYKNQSGTYRIVAFISGFVGSTLLLYAIYHFVANLLERRRRRLQFSEIRRALSQQRRPTRNVEDTDTGEEEEGEENSELRQEDICVVCLTNPRQVIALPCGHFAICADCAELIPYPKRCPMCRASVEKFYPVYRS